MPADPALELRARLVRLHFHAVVHAADPNAFFRPLFHLAQPRPVALHDLVTRPAVHVENDRIRAVENFLILRPAIQDDLESELRRTLRETLREEQRARVEFVHPRRVRGFARDDDELGFAVRCL